MRKATCLPRPSAGSGCVVLTWCLFSLAGCSEDGAGATGSTMRRLEESEIVAIGETSKTQKAFREALKRKQMEKAGIVLPKKTSSKVKKNVH